MSRLCICREYEDMFTEGFKYVESLEKHDEQIRADERINAVQFIVDEFNRRTVCLGRAKAKTYVINTLNEILKELKEQK